MKYLFPQLLYPMLIFYSRYIRAMKSFSYFKSLLGLSIKYQNWTQKRCGFGLGFFPPLFKGLL